MLRWELQVKQQLRLGCCFGRNRWGHRVDARITLFSPIAVIRIGFPKAPISIDYLIYLTSLGTSRSRI